MVIKLPWSLIYLVNNENVNVMVAHVMVMAIWLMMMMVTVKIMGTDQTMTDAISCVWRHMVLHLMPYEISV